MGTSVDLAREVAASFGLPERSVQLTLKHVRKIKGAITFKGHGKGAAEMGARDAAALLIAVAGNAYAANAADTYGAFAGLTELQISGGDTLLSCLEKLIADIRQFGADRPPPDWRDFRGRRPTVLPEACLKLIWVDAAVGGDRPRIATVCQFVGKREDVAKFGQKTRTFASEALPRGYYDEARLMADCVGVSMTATKTVSLRTVERIAWSF
jgi:hypothetical protein